MNKLKLSLLAVAGAFAVAGGAHAEERPLNLTFNAGAATDYVFRGISQTNEKPQIYGGADISFAKIAYAGVWLSNVDFGDGTDTEYDLYAGIKPTAGPVTFDFGAIHYGYINAPSGADWDYWELKAAASVPVGPGTVGAAIYWSDDFTGGVGSATYYELNGSVAIPNSKFSVSGAVGYQDVKTGDYTTWNLGVGYALNEHIGFDLRYWDTDEHDFGNLFDSRVVFGLKTTF